MNLLRYLEGARGLSIIKSGLFAALPYFIVTFASWALTHLSDGRLRGQGAGQRRWLVSFAMLGAAVCC